MIDAWRKSDADAAHHAPHHGPSPAPESREPERSRARHMGSCARHNESRGPESPTPEGSQAHEQGPARGEEVIVRRRPQAKRPRPVAGDLPIQARAAERLPGVSTVAGICIGTNVGADAVDSLRSPRRLSAERAVHSALRDSPWARAFAFNVCPY